MPVIIISAGIINKLFFLRSAVISAASAVRLRRNALRWFSGNLLLSLYVAGSQTAARVALSPLLAACLIAACGTLP